LQAPSEDAGRGLRWLDLRSLSSLGAAISVRLAIAQSMSISCWLRPPADGELDCVSWRLAKIDCHPAMILPASNRFDGYLADAMERRGAHISAKCSCMRRYRLSYALSNLPRCFSLYHAQRHFAMTARAGALVSWWRPARLACR
jgi:hypothetical protein